MGYQSENAINIINELSESFGDINIHIAFNHDYIYTGTLKSLLIGKQALPFNDNFLVIEGDVVCEDKIIEIISKEIGNVLIGDSSRTFDEESMMYNIDSSRILKAISKRMKPDKVDGEFIGVSLFDFDDWTRFSQYAIEFDRNHQDAFYEDAFIGSNVPFKVLDIHPLKWTEVDFPVEYKKARQIFANEEKLEIDQSLFEQTSHSPSIFSFTENMDIEIKDFCFLANPYLLNDSFIEKISIELKRLIGTYPPLQPQLAKYVSDFHDGILKTENIIVGNGATELINIMNYWSRGSIVPIPTFSEYTDSTNNLLTYPLKSENNFDLDMEEFINFCKQYSPEDYSNIIIINPNNPVGKTLEAADVIKIIENLPEFRIILDESFLDFSAPRNSLFSKVKQYSNLVIVKSYGKTLGMPGLRLGAIYSTENIILDIKNKVPVWNVNALATYVLQLMSTSQFKNELKSAINKVKEDTAHLYDGLSKIPYLYAYKPTGNYVLIKILNEVSGTELRNELLRDKIFVRDCSNKIGLSPQFVRVASRTREENNYVVRHIEMLLADLSKE